jgi:DNA-binding IclR family transcriptional regulator
VVNAVFAAIAEPLALHSLDELAQASGLARTAASRALVSLMLRGLVWIDTRQRPAFVLTADGHRRARRS